MKEARNWKRLTAFIVDVLIVNIFIVSPLNDSIEDSLLDINNLSELININVSLKLVWISVLIGVLTVLYWSILEYKLSQTIGAMLFDIRVKSVDNKKISFGRILLRNLSKISTLLLIVDDIHILFSDKKQRYLEKISQTATMEEK